MLRRSLFISALMLAGVVGFASSAKAATEDTTFTAKIDPACNFITPVGGDSTGTLLPNAAKTALSTSEDAYVGLECSGGDLSIADPVPDGLNPTATTTNAARITTLSGQVVHSPASTGALKTTVLVAGDSGDATIEMDASVATGTLAAGDYTYTVTVTAVP